MMNISKWQFLAASLIKLMVLAGSAILIVIAIRNNLKSAKDIFSLVAGIVFLIYGVLSFLSLIRRFSDRGDQL